MKKDIHTKKNLIVALRIGELMVTQLEMPPKKSRKSIPNIKSTKNVKNVMKKKVILLSS